MEGLNFEMTVVANANRIDAAGGGCKSRTCGAILPNESFVGGVALY
jgi:hypothetical protein